MAQEETVHAARLPNQEPTTEQMVEGKGNGWPLERGQEEVVHSVVGGEHGDFDLSEFVGDPYEEFEFQLFAEMPKAMYRKTQQCISNDFVEIGQTRVKGVVQEGVLRVWELYKVPEYWSRPKVRNCCTFAILEFFKIH